MEQEQDYLVEKEPMHPTVEPNEEADFYIQEQGQGLCLMHLIVEPNEEEDSYIQGQEQEQGQEEQ